MANPDPEALVLSAAYHYAVREATAEAGYERLRKLTGAPADDARWAEAIAACLAAGYVKEPVRLEPGSLQCHWRLELTPEGVAAARANAV
ncbi:MAG: hypothetical protein JOY71_12750 [Acetobacteraceae bacterium]|nr:hypothetical protein [Acetobacteraceae bacterium]MBV8589821.1 hypothetical protein [Acetobacteraceae bacterium]